MPSSPYELHPFICCCHLSDLHTHVIKHGPMSETCTRFVLGEICAALLSIHDLGLAFIDLKPENVLITEVGHVKLADFGACRAVTREGREVLAGGNVLLRNLRGALGCCAMQCSAVQCHAVLAVLFCTILYCLYGVFDHSPLLSLFNSSPARQEKSDIMC